MPALSGSASVRGKDLTISLVNAHATLPAEVEFDVSLDEARVSTLSHEDITAHNTFEQADAVTPRTSRGLAAASLFVLPPASITVIQSQRG
jgi:alpha-N-arabinofuranosidase